MKECRGNGTWWGLVVRYSKKDLQEKEPVIGLCNFWSRPRLNRRSAGPDQTESIQSDPRSAVWESFGLWSGSILPIFGPNRWTKHISMKCYKFQALQPPNSTQTRLLIFKRPNTIFSLFTLSPSGQFKTQNTKTQFWNLSPLPCMSVFLSSLEAWRRNRSPRRLRNAPLMNFASSFSLIIFPQFLITISLSFLSKEHQWYHVEATTFPVGMSIVAALPRLDFFTFIQRFILSFFFDADWWEISQILIPLSFF